MDTIITIKFNLKTNDFWNNQMLFLGKLQIQCKVKFLASEKIGWNLTNKFINSFIKTVIAVHHIGIVDILRQE